MGRKRKGEEVDLAAYQYVDAFFRDPTGKKPPQKWKRIPVDEVESFKNTNSSYNVYCTVQRYRNKVRNKPEFAFAPLYFDIDSDRSFSQLIKDGFLDLDEAVKVLDSPVLHNWKMGFEPDEDDCKTVDGLAADELKQELWLWNLEISREDVRRLLEFFIGHFELKPEDIRVWFSGKKGFHVLVDPIVLAIEPRTDLHKVFKHIALFLISDLKLTSIDHGSIYSDGRQLRLDRSVHHSSGCFKIEVTHDEIMDADVEYIVQMAHTPRAPIHGDYYVPFDDESTQVSDAAANWYAAKVKEYEEIQRTKTTVVTLKDEVLSQMEGYPMCVQHLLDNGIVKAGERNKATMALVSYYKDAGFSLEQTEELLVEWLEKQNWDLISSSKAEAESGTRSAARTIYEGDQYHFGCQFIRSIAGSRENGQFRPVPCAGRACPAHEDHRAAAMPAEKVHLSQAGDKKYVEKEGGVQKKIAFDCLVSGSMDKPYIVPKKVRYFCPAMDESKAICQTCILLEFGGQMEQEFNDNDRFLIEAANQPDAQLKGVLRSYAHASCNKVQAEVLSYENVTEILVTPMAERVSSVRIEGDKLVPAEVVDETGNKFATQRMYAIGMGLTPNEHYEVEGYVYPHPKNQEATILSQKQTPKQDSISSFQMTDDLKDAFSVFQVQPGENLDDRVDLIVQDIVDNVTQVRERFTAHLALLMLYHSVQNYYFQDVLQKRGWLFATLVGDSGQAKSQMVANFMEYAGLGELISAESSSRTGILYNLQQYGDRWFITWGRFPLNDRKILAIDEFSEIPEGDFEQMTNAISEGVLKIDRAAKGETNCRTRLMLMSNPKGAGRGSGKQLKDFTYGIESLKTLFASPADIRRVDIAVLLKSGDVPKEVLNKEYPKPKMQVVSPDAMKASVLWAWSRKADQIIIDKAATKAILKAASDLGEKYGYAQDIPLMEPADLRHKIARLSIALSAFVHSTDEAHEQVIVTPEHVGYVKLLLELIYDNKNCRMDVYAASQREVSELSADEREQIRDELEKLDFADHAPVSDRLLQLFHDNDYLRVNDVIDMTGYERAQVIQRMDIFSKHKMIRSTRNGYKKLPKMIEYLDL